MDPMEFISKIAWPLVWVIGFIVLLAYRGSLGNLISNLKKGTVSNKKGEGFSVNVEVGHPSPENIRQGTSLSYELLESEVSDDIQKEKPQKMEIEVEVNWVVLFYEKKYQEAHKELLKQIEQNADIVPDDMIWYRGEAAKILCKYNYQEGVKEFETLINDNPDSGAVYLMYIEAVSDAGDLDLAFSLVDKYPGNKSNKYALLFHKAELLLDKRANIDGALIIIDELISQNDNLAIKSKAHILKGKILKKQEKVEEAKKCLFRAYKILPTTEFILREIADFFAEMGDSKSELFFRKQLADLNSEESNNWGYLGNTYVSLSLNSRAMDAYERANQLTASKEQWLIANIGNLYNNIGLYNKAIEYLNKAVEMASSDQYSHNRLASSLSNKEEEDKKVTKLLEETRELIAKVDNEQPQSDSNQSNE